MCRLSIVSNVLLRALSRRRDECTHSRVRRACQGRVDLSDLPDGHAGPDGCLNERTRSPLYYRPTTGMSYSNPPVFLGPAPLRETIPAHFTPSREATAKEVGSRCWRGRERIASVGVE